MRIPAALLLFFTLFTPLSGETVTRVLDGDTIQVDGKTIRLEGVDAPETTQRFGDRATEWLEYAVANREVTVHESGTDRYGRTLAKVTIKVGDRDVDIGEALLYQGLAWHYVKYNQDARLAQIQNDARSRRAGLWVDARRVAPWDYRNGQEVATPIPVNRESIRTTDTKVFITETGSKYHTAGCRYLRKSRIEIPLSRAKSAYSPCSVCRPPR